MAGTSQEVRFCRFDEAPLEGQLGLRAPPFGAAKEPFRQLRYIEKYVRHLQCRSIAIERRYIDRDYIEDHSIFYARSFFPYDNFCKRVHFFSIEQADVQACLTELLGVAHSASEREYRAAYEDFSEKAYLGFVVIKPLHGCPVGRTVLRSYARTPHDTADYYRSFGPTRKYRPHFMGVELCVRGLGFQQQDTGVSACATTALWSALQKVRDFEDVAAATPAQITTLASQHSLPFGRTMPSEGLSVEQMCQAIQAVGLSPNLFKINRLDMARGLLYSAAMSEMAPILILRKNNGLSHAVTLAGIKLRESHVAEHIVAGCLDEQSTDLVALYVHDDRHGPYLSASFTGTSPNAAAVLNITTTSDSVEEDDDWVLSHVLIPMHSKIRLSFQSLRDVGSGIVFQLADMIHALDNTNSDSILIDTRIIRSYRYVKELLLKKATINQVERFCSTFHLPRYTGIIQLRSKFFGAIDLLVDTTDTARNLHCLAIVGLSETTQQSKEVLEFLAKKYEAELCLPNE